VDVAAPGECPLQRDAPVAQLRAGEFEPLAVRRLLASFVKLLGVTQQRSGVGASDRFVLAVRDELAVSVFPRRLQKAIARLASKELRLHE
jgi:hypothetical protein